MQMGPLSLRLVIFWLRKGNDFTLKTSPIPSRPPQPPSCSLSLSIVQHAVILCFHAWFFLYPEPLLYLLLSYFSTGNMQYASTDKTRRQRRDQDHLFLWKKLEQVPEFDGSAAQVCSGTWPQLKWSTVPFFCDLRLVKWRDEELGRTERVGLWGLWDRDTDVPLLHKASETDRAPSRLSH